MAVYDRWLFTTGGGSPKTGTIVISLGPSLLFVLKAKVLTVEIVYYSSLHISLVPFSSCVSCLTTDSFLMKATYYSLR